jgi:flavin reductase (DIM6/NTAB) family NADH-FMN oxidoreductase RutF
MTAAWGGIVASDPPSIGVSVRPTRMTHYGITANKAFTVGVPSVAIISETDYFGIVSGRQHNKFEEAKLTPVTSNLVKAPYVEECPIILECKLHKSVDLNSHILFVGHILNVLVEESALTNDEIDPIKVNPLIYAPNQQYYKIGEPIGKAFSIGKKHIHSRQEI